MLVSDRTCLTEIRVRGTRIRSTMRRNRLMANLTRHYSYKATFFCRIFAIFDDILKWSTPNALRNLIKKNHHIWHKIWQWNKEKAWFVQCLPIHFSADSGYPKIGYQAPVPTLSLKAAFLENGHDGTKIQAISCQHLNSLILFFHSFCNQNAFR